MHSNNVFQSQPSFEIHCTHTKRHVGAASTFVEAAARRRRFVAA